MASNTDALEAEAAVLSPILTALNEEYTKNQISDYDFVGAFILLYVAHRRPRKWSCGKLQPPIYMSSTETTPPSRCIATIPALFAALDASVLSKLLSPSIPLEQITIVDIYRYIRLSGIKKNNDNLVNRSIVYWAHNLWPFQLLTHIPTPMDVLRMQANNSRVISLFYKDTDLSSVHEAMLTYMIGSKVAAKDAFDFLVHDITHMEHYMLPESHLEQMGLMRSLLALHNGAPRRFFKLLFPCDAYLWSELEYLISDMNCFLPHLLKYLLAKILGACLRRLITLSGACLPGVDIREQQGGLSAGGEIYRTALFHHYASAVWGMVLCGLGIAAGTVDYQAGMYFLDKSYHSVGGKKGKIEGGTEERGSTRRVVRGVELACLTEECSRVAAVAENYAVSHSTSSNYKIDNNISNRSICQVVEEEGRVEWTDATAGERLRVFFRAVGSIVE